MGGLNPTSQWILNSYHCNANVSLKLIRLENRFNCLCNKAENSLNECLRCGEGTEISK